MLILPSRSLQNGTLINGVCHINQSSVPATRPDGSALVIGDKWYKSDTFVDFFWNGTYWATDLMQSAPFSLTNSTGGLNATIISDSVAYDLFIENVIWSGRTGTSNSGSAFRLLTLMKYDNSGSNTPILSNFYNSSTFTANTYFSQGITFNRFVSLSGNVLNSATPTSNLIYIRSEPSGSPGAVTESLRATYRLVAK